VRGVAHIGVAEEILDQARARPLVGYGVAGGMAQHVRVSLQIRRDWRPWIVRHDPLPTESLAPPPFDCEGAINHRAQINVQICTMFPLRGQPAEKSANLPVFQPDPARMDASVGAQRCASPP
jgi:hypothetical protein